MHGWRPRLSLPARGYDDRQIWKRGAQSPDRAEEQEVMTMEDPRISQPSSIPTPVSPGESVLTVESVKVLRCLQCGEKIPLPDSRTKYCSLGCSLKSRITSTQTRGRADSIVAQIEAINRKFEMLKNHKRELVHQLKLLGYRYGKQDGEED